MDYRCEMMTIVQRKRDTRAPKVERGGGKVFERFSLDVAALA